MEQIDLYINFRLKSVNKKPILALTHTHTQHVCPVEQTKATLFVGKHINLQTVQYLWRTCKATVSWVLCHTFDYNRFITLFNQIE